MSKRSRNVALRSALHPSDLPPWTPLVRTTLEPMTLLERLNKNEALAKRFGTTVDAVQRNLSDLEKNDEIYINSRYQVNVRRIHNDNPEIPDMVHLSIKRLDKMQIGPERYRDFMRIKDELLSPEHEAIEILPARSREIDTSNQYHMWAIDNPEWRIPFGWTEGRKVVPPTAGQPGGAVQSPFEAHHRI
jgi:hypothetical protein